MKLNVVKVDGKMYVNSGAFIKACEIALELILDLRDLPGGKEHRFDENLHRESLAKFKEYIRREER